MKPTSWPAKEAKTPEVFKIIALSFVPVTDVINPDLGALTISGVTTADIIIDNEKPQFSGNLNATLIRGYLSNSVEI